MPWRARPASKECESVKKSLVAFTLLASVGVIAHLVSGVYGQQGSARRPTVSPGAVGVVDLAKVLKEYQQFQGLREQMRSRVEDKEGQLQKMMNEAKLIRDQQTKLDANSQTYRDNESKLTQKLAEIETFRQQTRRDLITEEATLYHDVYGNVRKAVAWVAEQRGVSLVLRISDDPISPSNPEEVIKAVNRQVLYSHDSLDLTDDVLQVINRSSTAAAKPRTDTQRK
jgi:outer membrane protein